jgi:hypothetical protein
VVYRRHTNFAIESIEQTFNGAVGFGKRVSCTVSRNGDLVTQMYLELTLKKGAAGSYFPAEAFIKDCEIEIGGQKCDKHYAAWYRVFDELTRTGSEKEAYRRLTDFVDSEATGTIKRFYVPLVFWFNRNPGLALPLIALQYHEVKLHFNFAAAADIHDVNNGEAAVDGDYVPTAVLYADYIYLDSDERRRYAQSAHEYLIEQVQFTGDENVEISASTQKSQNIRLNFNHPVKYLAWVVSHKDRHGLFNTKEEGEDAEQFAPLRTAKLLLNGHDRFSQRYGSYFNQVQTFQHWQSKPAAGIYAYSFALRPADQTLPSGSCNFSRIDNATLQLTFKQASVDFPTANITDPENTTVQLTTPNKLEQLKIFAVNYNVLRVLSGMGGLAYSN